MRRAHLRQQHVQVRRKLQIKLANINVPHYITPLRLQTLDLGNVPPMVKSAHSMPSPEPNLVPRLVMHVVYNGACKLVIQTNMDLKVRMPSEYGRTYSVPFRSANRRVSLQGSVDASRELLCNFVASVLPDKNCSTGVVHAEPAVLAVLLFVNGLQCVCRARPCKFRQQRRS
jgi:hypothetical protein